MKYELPIDHGLSSRIIETLVFTQDGSHALTDVQYAALEAGLGKGKSILALSPTSTGKTQIAVWAIANGIESNLATVYLVTHRALAQQKFKDFQDLLCLDFLNRESSKIVLATGDGVIDGRGENPADPLNSPILVATYEKYLAMLSASGVTSSMTNTVIICDEIQLIGDKSRGRNVEVLLTILRNAGWQQFVGLSAVLDNKDGEDLSNWLNVRLLRVFTREKILQYEYWSSKSIDCVKTSEPDKIDQKPLPLGVKPNVHRVIRYLEKKTPTSLPIIVFCMRKQDVYDLASDDLKFRIEEDGAQLPLIFGDLPETTANSFLSQALSHRIAIHSADLTDEERKIVEDGLINKQIDVVYATSTLAAGVNFPLGIAIFSKWLRWDFDVRAHRPIETSEFHNMAGRAGRMGSSHEEGRVIFFPAPGVSSDQYRMYLKLDEFPPIDCRITTDVFDQLSLQLITSGLCQKREDVKELICKSFSGLREADNNLGSFQTWPQLIDIAVNLLIETSLVVEMTDRRLLATPVGKAVANSGFKPKSAEIIIDYFVRKGEILSELLNSPLDINKLNRFAYLIFAASFSLPEFRPSSGEQPSRFLPWPLQDLVLDANEYANDLLEPSWYADPIATNSAQVSLDWVNGEKLLDQEKIHSGLRAGMVLEMYRNLGWVLQGLSSILSAATDSRIPNPMRPKALKGQNDLLIALKKLPRSITRLSFRVSIGLPDDILWMSSLNQSGEPFRLRREEMLTLRKNNFARPELLMVGTSDADQIRQKVFKKIKPSPQAKANWLRNRCRNWKSDQRIRVAERHRERATGCVKIELIDEFYSSRGNAFEIAFEKILEYLNIAFVRMDDKSTTGAPDYLIQLDNSPPLIFELKSREGNNLVAYNGATEVLAAAEIHGHKDTFCITLCHPGVDPSVPMAITGSGRLSVVETNDLGEGLLRLCQGRITQEQLWQWLSTPGQALSVDLPFTEH